MFDWPDFLQSHNVHYVTSGPNCPKGDVAVRCPFCPDDPSEHMAINIDGAGWHCWRNRSHAGRNPVKLIQALIGCSYDQARLIAGQNATIPSDFLDRVNNMMLDPTGNAPAKPLEMPREFRPLKRGPVLARPYLRYLKQRGYRYPEKVAKQYNLHYCVWGAFGGRIIFPVYFYDQLVSWTGRTINPDKELRYKSLTTTPAKAEKEGTAYTDKPIGHYLLWFDKLSRNDNRNTICICEGPFDALRVNYLGSQFGVDATCIFTNAPSNEQIELLFELLPKYKRKIILLDQNTLPLALTLQNKLAGIKTELALLPDDLKDPGELKSSNDLLALLA